MTLDDPITRPSPIAAPPAPPPDSALAISVENLHKSFRIPTHRVDSLKERVVRPFSSREYRELRALAGISFDVTRGEFFGIVGRNGSGKSTLLKILASIYRADAGRIRMAGRLAPFIELGVGFNAELSARENVVLNGVMMGLTPAEARNRLDAVIDFAELREFVDLKLKNYSSGMLVRLAFSLMLQVDADILLIDEVLAVGDASFQQKCDDAFHEMKTAGKTIILVTHEMSTVEEYCDRAMLISDGLIDHIGDPAEVGRKYLRLNFEQGSNHVGSAHATDRGAEVRVLDAYAENTDGERVNTVEQGTEIRLGLELEATQDLEGLDIGFIVANADGVGVTKFDATVGVVGAREIAAGQTVTVSAALDNPFAAGRYFVHCGINRAFGHGVALYVHNAIDFVVFGTGPDRGIVEIPVRASGTIDAPNEP